MRKIYPFFDNSVNMTAVLDPYALYDADNWGEIDPAKQYRMEAVEVFEIGTHKGGVYTGGDLKTIAKNFNRFYFCNPRPLLVPPAVIGHEEDQKVLTRTDLPAAGWVKNVWVSGTKLMLNIGNMPGLVMKWVCAGLISTVSVEIYADSGEAGLTPGFGPTMRRVALIGGDLPQVKSIGKLPNPIPERQDVQFFTESRRYMTSKLPPLGKISYFTETSTAPTESNAMNQDVFNNMKKAGVDDDTAKKMAEYCNDPSKMKAMSGMFKGGGDVPPPAGGASTGGFDRSQAIEFLCTKHGIDRASLDAKTDEELQAMMGNSLGGDAKAMSDDNDEDDKGGDKDKSEQMADDMPTKLTTKTQDNQQDELTTTGRGTPAAGVAIKQSEKAKVHKMSETASTQKLANEIAVRHTEFMNQVKEQRARELVAAEKAKGIRVKKFCEQAVKDGLISPAELDAGLRAQLLRADNNKVLKFSEGNKNFEGTELEMQIAAIEARPKLAIFSERMPSQAEQEALTSRVNRILQYTETGRNALKDRASSKN